MSGLRTTIGIELLKARRSRVPWGVAVGFTIAPLVMGLFMLILQHPDAARSMGVIGAKAELTAGTADWPTYLSMVGQAVAIGGAVLFAFLTAWVFGREFADRTVRTLLASPTRRRSIVLGKAVVTAAWAAGIATWVLAVSMVIGLVLELPGWSTEAAVSALGGIVLAVVLTIALQSATALLAGVGRGYLAALGWAIATVAVSQVLAVLGWGSWFPWAVPAILGGAGGSAVDPVTPAAVVLVLVVAAGGLWLTIRWWDRADQAG